MKKIWLFAIVGLACGCGEREKAPAPRPAPVEIAQPARPAPPPRPAPEGPMIACFGDSLTAGFGLDPGESYPDLLQKEMDRSGRRYRVVNFGISGDTSQDGLARVSLVVAEKPAIVVLEFGANDGLRGLPVSNTESNLAQMVDALEKADARVVLAGITLPPNYGPEYIRKFDAMYRDVAARYKLKLIPFLLEGVGGNPRLMQRDGLHPNREGTRTVAATVSRALEPLL